MGVAVRIFARDLKRILVNPVALIITIGVCILPALYAWLNILANWDPYENTSTMPVAVVIEDEGADIEDMGHTNAGELIRERLEQDTQLDWTFVDEDAAIEGVRAGTYFAAFVIPPNFTSSLADVLNGDTQQAHIHYYVNEKVNAISPKVTDTGASTLEAQISGEFVHVVGETVTDRLQGAAVGAASDVDTATKDVASNLHEVHDLLNELADGLDNSQTAISSARDTVSQARDTLSMASDDTSSLSSSLDETLGTLGTTRTNVSTLATRLSSTLGGGASTIAGVSSRSAYDIGILSGNVGWATGRLDAAIAQLQAINDTTRDVKTSLEETREAIEAIDATDDATRALKEQVIEKLNEQIDLLARLSDTQLARIVQLQQFSADVKEGNEALLNLSDSVNEAIQSSSQTLTDLQSSLTSTTIPQVSNALDELSGAGGRTRGTAETLPPMLDQADATLAQLDAVLAQAAQAVAQTADSVRSSADEVGTLAADTDAAQSAETFKGIKEILGLDPEQVGEFMGSPVKIVSQAVFPVANYGSGVAPFYTNLALWVGGFVLVAIYRLEVDEEGVGRVKPWQGFFGRGLLLSLFGQLQAIICCVGDLLLGIQCLSPVAFIFAGMVESLVYVSLIYAVSVAFRHVGKALAVLLVVLQIPGAAGTYPIEMMPEFFQALHPWLPFTYGIDAMREAIAGFYDGRFALHLCALLAFLVPALLIGVSARRYLINVNTLFDRKLAETDLMITERGGQASTGEPRLEAGHFRLSTIVKVLSDSDSYKRTLLKRAAKFELRYPKIVKRGFAALLWVPLALLGLLFVLPNKFALLVCWIVSLIAICTLLIVSEYLHSRINAKTTLADMDHEQLYALLDEKLREEFMAFAPIDKMRLNHTQRDTFDHTKRGGDAS